MKLVLLIGVLLVGAYAKNWDLSSVDASADWTKAAAVDRSNQGYTARYTHQGKLLKLSLPVHKERNVRVTDTDRLLFGMEGASSELEESMANMTMPREETARLCKRALGSKWETMVQLPAEDLTFLESLRLAASLNEYNLLAAGDNSKKTRSYSHEHEASFPSDWDCICHATHHRFPWSGHESIFWGVRLLKKTQYYHPEHLDCLLCDHTSVTDGREDDLGAGFEFDCRWCCYGECVAGLPTTPNMNGTPWNTCDIDFAYDTLRTDTEDITFNYYRLNDVGLCRLPRVFHCVEEVHRWCENCENFLDVIINEDTETRDARIESCRYCDLVVGANPHICRNCSEALEAIEDFSGDSDGFREFDGVCSCDQAMAHVIAPHYEGDHEEGDHYDGYENYDYGRDYSRDYDYRYEGDHEEGDHHESYESHEYTRPYDYSRDYNRDYDYSRDYNRDYDYSRDYNRDYDYSRDYNRDYDYRYEGDHEEGDHHESYESYDYRRPYDYDYNGDHEEGDHHESYESHDYTRPYDYSRDYNRDYDYSRDYDYDYRADYRGDGYESHEYVQDHYVHPQGYDYGRDYNRYEGDHEEGDHHESYESHDYARPYDYSRDYDYDYDFDFRAGSVYQHEGDNEGYESGRDYNRGDGYESHDYRYESHEGDHYESNDYSNDYSRDYDYNRRPYDYDYRG